MPKRKHNKAVADFDQVEVKVISGVKELRGSAPVLLKYIEKALSKNAEKEWSNDK